MKNMIAILASAGLLSSALFASSIPQRQEQRVVVTTEGRKDSPPPDITPADVMVSVDGQRAQVTGWTPTSAAGTELWVLIDDGSNTDVSLQYPDLRKFMLSQPASTRIGVAYLRNGSAVAAQALTADHAAAAKALRIPMATPGISASPYLALTELIHKWPASNSAREVLMVSSGVDPDNGPGPINPYLTRSIETAQKAGVVVYSIYYGGAGHFGHSFWQIQWGQKFLAQLSDETGGEFYWQGNLNPVSFAPYMTEIARHLNNQHVLAFQPPAAGHGEQKLKVTTEIPRASLITQSQVYVGK